MSPRPPRAKGSRPLLLRLDPLPMISNGPRAGRKFGGGPAFGRRSGLATLRPGLAPAVNRQAPVRRFASALRVTAGSPGAPVPCPARRCRSDPRSSNQEEVWPVWVLHINYRGRQHDRTVCVIDGAGVVRFSSRTVQEAMVWLLTLGRVAIGVPVEGEVQVYRIERRDCLLPGPDEYILRRMTNGQHPDLDAPDPLRLPLSAPVRTSQASVVIAKASHRRRRKTGR